MRLNEGWDNNRILGNSRCHIGVCLDLSKSEDLYYSFNVLKFVVIVVSGCLLAKVFHKVL